MYDNDDGGGGLSNQSMSYVARGWQVLIQYWKKGIPGGYYYYYYYYYDGHHPSCWGHHGSTPPLPAVI